MGLEVHVYLPTRAKLFCGCDAAFLDAEPNTHVCPICTGQPGAKPMVPNRAALRAALAIGAGVNATLLDEVRFLRKHYFYPDQPVNYQRTSRPQAVDGELAGVPITGLHVEEDPGALDPRAGTVDHNRAGVPLVELVTAPALDGSEEAVAFLDELRLVLDHLEGWRREAGVKVDVNVSLDGGERVEVKNVHSVRGVAAAVEHEVARQRQLVEEGGRIERETRAFDEATGTTSRLRTKESLEDYRYLPDPDLPAWRMPRAWLDEAAAMEPPLARRARLAAVAGVADSAFSPILQDPELTHFFEELAQRHDPAATFRYLVRDYRAELEYRGLAARDAPVGLAAVDALLGALLADEVTPHVATRLLRQGFDEGGLAESLAAERGKGVGEDALGTAVAAALAENERAVADYRSGKQEALNFLLGQVLRRLEGRADPKDARETLRAALDAEDAG